MCNFQTYNDLFDARLKRTYCRTVKYNNEKIEKLFEIRNIDDANTTKNKSFNHEPDPSTV